MDALSNFYMHPNYLHHAYCDLCQPDLQADPTTRHRFVGVIGLNPLCNGVRSARRHHRTLHKYFQFILINFYFFYPIILSFYLDQNRNIPPNPRPGRVSLISHLREYF